MTRITAKNIAKACVEAGLPADIELVRGEGYFYFAGEEPSIWPANSVYTYRMSDLSIEMWVEEAKALRADAVRSGAIPE